MAKSYVISDGYKGKIDDVISRVGNQPEGSVQRIQTRFESMPGDGGKVVFRICTFTGAWATSSVKAVTFKYQTTTPNTASVTNLFFPYPENGTKDCAIAKEGTAWFLIDVPLVVATLQTATITYMTGGTATLNTATCGIVFTPATATAVVLSSTTNTTYLTFKV